MSGMSQSNMELFEIIRVEDLYKCRCKICGYVTVSMIERVAIMLMKEHLRNAHNVKI
jgi:hypothetical protein